ncbi:MAG: gephyrin-like molybdotransferase Glp [Candidatus Nanopelagicales bacterium]
MRTVEEHLTHCLEHVRPLSPIELQLLEAQGGLLAEPVVAGRDIPMYDAATVDGYAVRAADVASASSRAPVRLPVIGDVASGAYGVPYVPPGASARICVDEPLPTGADAVVPGAETDVGVVAVRVRRPVAAGAHLLTRGMEATAGQVMLDAGTRIEPSHIGLLAALGREQVLVRPRPRVVVLSVGPDLVEPGQPLSIGQRVDAGSYLLTTAVRASGAIAYRVGIVPDDPRRLADTIEDQLIRADLVLVTAGRHEQSQTLVREVLSRLGKVAFVRVAMRPGAVQGFGVIGPDSTPIFALSDDAFGIAVSFEIFVRPVIRVMLGADPVHRPAVDAVLKADIRSDPGLRDFVCARLGVEEGRYVVTPIVDNDGGPPAGHSLARLASSDALVAVPEASTWLGAGDPAAVMVLERRR